ncbi:MAG: VWA domain-containing protein [Bacteroidales bacterium]|nr:VWA domain-containing protein [Lentimicrobiaceae bacterium]MDD5694554.1 VWA domain-containing protein [Bacteroidales bacterium]
MKPVRYIVVLVLVLTAALCRPQITQPGPELPQPTTRILFVFDASQSMYGQWQSDEKIRIARNLLIHILDSLKTTPKLEMALRVYGHQKPYPPQDCDDTKLEVPFGQNNAGKIINVLKTLVPKGSTPIAYALEQTKNDFSPCDNCRNIIVLITDGIEECDGDPCAVSRALQKNGIAMKPFIIGIGRDFRNDFECVGTYYDASNEEEFQSALNIVISQVLNSTTAQVNLLDTHGNPTETNVNMTFYDHVSGQVVYNFIHTINNKGVPDTVRIDPLLAYNLVVHTLPPVTLDSITLTPGKHTIIALDAPQGILDLRVGKNDRTIKDLYCIVRQADDMQTLNVQSFGIPSKYLTGTYDLEILTLPRIYINDVAIKQSHTTLVEIPQPGILVIAKSVNGYGSLYLEDGNELKWIYDLQENKLQESLVLQPGSYRIIFRSKYLNQTLYTIEKKFKIEPGVTLNLKIYQAY